MPLTYLWLGKWKIISLLQIKERFYCADVDMQLSLITYSITLTLNDLIPIYSNNCNYRTAESFNTVLCKLDNNNDNV